MNINLFMGTILLVAGAVLLYFGYTASQSLGEQVHETFMGRFSDSTTWYFVLGIAAAIAGVILLAFKANA